MRQIRLIWESKAFEIWVHRAYSINRSKPKMLTLTDKAAYHIKNGGTHMEQGTVKWFNARRGYGFLTGDDGNDYFVHHSNIVMDGFRTLRSGQAVTYGIEKDGEERSIAVDVKIVE